MTRKNKSKVSSVELVQTEQVQTEQVQTEQVQTEQVQTEQVETEQVQTEQVQTEQVETEQVQTKVVQPKTDRNEGVGKVVRKMIQDGMSNKDIQVKLEELYGNNKTTYACIAWYRNKMKKDGTVQKTSSALESVKKFLETCSKLSDEEKTEILENIEQVL